MNVSSEMLFLHSLTPFLAMEQPKSKPTSESNFAPKYVQLPRSPDDEHEICPTCGHVQSTTPQKLAPSSIRPWLILWTTTVVLWGTLIVGIMFVAKQHKCLPSHTGNSLGSNLVSLLSDRAFPHSASRNKKCCFKS